MKNIITTILSVFVLSIIFSCNKKDDTILTPKNEVPEALKENNSSLKRYSKRNDDLTNQLYNDLVEKSPDLQNLEKEIEIFNPNETIEEFDNYNMKSKDYYLSSKFLTNKINDSILKNKILALLKKSNDKYFIKENEFNNIISKVNNKEKSIDDYHNVLKVLLTLPIIEKYQNENIPSKSKLESIIKKEDSIIEKTKKMTPKY